MKIKRPRLAVGIGLIALSLPFSLRGQESSCIDCHKELDGKLKAPVEAWGEDIHQQYGLACTACHGGNAGQEDIDLAKDRSFKGAPQKKNIPELCGSCHADAESMRRYSPNIRADQLELYWTSQHGRSLKKGNARVAVCTDCHGVHGIKDAKSPKSMIFPWNIPQTCGRCHADKAYMATSAIPTNQLEDYKQSVHAQALFEKKDLSAPACNDCHGNHGAQPPGVASIAFVCRQCHPSAGDLFSQSPHKAAYDALDISECEACHGNHKILRPSDEMLGTAEKAVCIQCHDPGSKPFEAALAMKQKIDDIRTRIESAEILLEKAEKRGVEVSEPKFKLQEARTNLIFIRNLTHGLSLEEITEKAGEGTAVIAEVQKAGDDALREARFRRSGLFVTNAFIILLAVALFLKIRQMKRRPSPQK